jgi:Reverse transcriptase (RNA-dependent DNA polymerase)
LKIGFPRLEADSCIHVKEIKSEINGHIIIHYQLVALYVNDLTLAASNKNLLTNLEKVFEDKFKIKELNKIKQILGIGIHHDKDRNIIYITQQEYIDVSVKAFFNYGINEFHTPMENKIHFFETQQPKLGSPEVLQAVHIHIVNLFEHYRGYLMVHVLIFSLL